MGIYRHLVPMLTEEDFEGMYKEGGRPPVSPRKMALVSLLQAMDRIPDREAAYDATVRLDWQVILGVETGWKGFDASLLTVFRRRLLDNPQVKDLFDRVLEKLVELKLIAPEGKQRLDSTWVFGLLRSLSRLENLKEGLRVALKAIEGSGKKGEDWVKGLPGPTWKRAMKKMDLRGMDGEERQEAAMKLGEDIWLVLDRLESAPPEWKELPEVKTLRTIFEQNFTVQGRKGGKKGKKKVRLELRDFKETPGQERISSPHEPEARYNSKADKSRGAIGYKIQVSETAKEEGPNFLTGVEVTGGATPDDGQAQKMIEALEKSKLIPQDLHTDSGYVSRNGRKELKKQHGVRQKGPTKTQAARGVTADPLRAPIERSIRELVSNGARRTPYRGKDKTRWWERMVGSVVNLKRLARAEAEGCLRGSGGKLSLQSA
jgi:transposase